MKLARITGLAAGVLALAVPAATASVTVRVEGAGSTLVQRTPVAATGADVTKPGGGACRGSSAAGALERATGGDWTGPWFGEDTGYFIEEIRGERHASDTEEYWAFWLNGRPAPAGICGVDVQAGDDVLFYPDCYGAACDPPEVLDLQVPRTAERGVPFTAKVLAHAAGYDESWNQTFTTEPAPGATIAVPGGTVRTGSDGTARIVLDREPGAVRLLATKPGTVREAEVVDLRAAGAKAPPCATNGHDGLCGTRDRTAPQGRITGIAEQQVFRRRGPRELTGTVADDPSGLLMVKLRLTRRHRGKCSYFSGAKERLRRTRCGRSFPFVIGDRADWSYLLPKRLRRGRYVLDVIAIDRAYNRDELARGRSRVVFHVR